MTAILDTIDLYDDAPVALEVLDVDLDEPARTPPKWAYTEAFTQRDGWHYREYQVRSFDAVLAAFREGFWRILMVQATGTGKCLGKGTPVLMFDGMIRPVETVRAGQLLMGPDSKPRRVLSICRGQEMLYRVTPTKGDSYVVNESHILSLRMTTQDRRVSVHGRMVSGGEIVNISVRDYLAAGKNFQHCAKGWRAPVNFPKRKLPIELPPYILGLWLGDGISRHASFAGIDQEVISEINWHALSLGMNMREERAEGKCPVFHITARGVDNSGKNNGGRGHRYNPMKLALYKLGLLQNEHIPQIYKANDRHSRLELLAGILDTDGSLTKDHSCYDYISSIERLADDVCFVARSLGFSAYKSPQNKTCGQNGKVGLYYRVCICGDTDEIPCRIQRKKASPRRQKKNVLNTGITVEPIGVGDYYGFTIDGDHLFMLGDFTVTHNTVAFTYLTQLVVAAGCKVLIIAHAEELLDQAADKLERSTGLKAAKEKANHRASLYDSVVVASVQTLSRPQRLQGWPANHFDLIIVDECHRSRAKSYETVLGYFTGPVLGVTATADRGDKQSLSTIFEKCAFEYNLLDAVRDGWLVRPIAKTLPLEIDLKGVKSTRTSAGSDYDLAEVSHRIEPFLGEIARLMKEETEDRGQGIVFTPSVATARMMQDALIAQGITAEYVSGECADRAEKIARFKGKYTRVLVNAMLLIEGFDHDAVDWVSVLRPTKIRGLFVQAVGRTTRPLTSILPKLNAAANAEERRAIIANSFKPNCLILDFLWLTEKLDLIRPVDLVARNEAVGKKAAEKPQDGDLIELEAAADRDLLKSLEKAAAKNAGRKGRTIDPLALAVSIKAEDLQHYQPTEKWEFKAPTAEQLKRLTKARMDVSAIHTAGMASKVISVLDQREKLGLCSPGQMQFLEKLGLEELHKLGIENPSLATAEQARKIVIRKTMQWRTGKHFKSAKSASATPNLL